MVSRLGWSPKKIRNLAFNQLAILDSKPSLKTLTKSIQEKLPDEISQAQIRSELWAMLASGDLSFDENWNIQPNASVIKQPVRRKSIRRNVMNLEEKAKALLKQIKKFDGDDELALLAPLFSDELDMTYGEMNEEGADGVSKAQA